MASPPIDTVVDALVYVALGVASLLFFIFNTASEHIRYHREARHDLPRLSAISFRQRSAAATVTT
jgi:hypothetical protein